MTGRKFEKHVPKDFSIDSDNTLSNSTAAIVPDKYDLVFIESQLRKIANDRSLVSNYFTALRAKFSLEKQIEILNAMERYNSAVASGVQSQVAILKAERDRRVSEWELRTVNEDIELRSSERQRQIAENQRKIDELRGRGSRGPKSPSEEYEQQQEQKLRREEIRRKIEMRRTISDIKGRLDLRRMLESVKNEEVHKIYDDVLKGKDLSEATDDERNEIARRLDDLDDLISDILARN
jgi:hypothetical protein